MTQTPELLPVEQSDREAAADFVRAWDDKYGDGQNDFGPSEVDSIWLRSGDHDGELIIQQFAAYRHRLSHAIHEPASVMREEAAKVAEANAATSVPLMNGPGVSASVETGRYRAAIEIARDIRNLPLSDGVG